MVEGARLESVFRGNSNVGSNPTLSAMESSKSLIPLIGRTGYDPQIRNLPRSVSATMNGAFHHGHEDVRFAAVVLSRGGPDFSVT